MLPPGSAFDGGDHRRLAVNGALGDHHAVVGLVTMPCFGSRAR